MSSPEDLQSLSGVDILEPLSREEVRRLGSRLPALGVGPGRIVYTPGYGARVIFLLLEGRVRIYKMVAERELTLVVLGAGTMFGEASLRTGGTQESYAQAMEPSRVCLMSHDQFRRLVMDNPMVGLKVVEVLSERQALYGNRMADIGLKEVTARLASLILQLYPRAAGRDGRRATRGRDQGFARTPGSRSRGVGS